MDPRRRGRSDAGRPPMTWPAPPRSGSAPGSRSARRRPPAPRGDDTAAQSDYTDVQRSGSTGGSLGLSHHPRGSQCLSGGLLPVPTGGVQRQLTLPPAPDSARHARRFVAEVLTDARADATLLDVATLLTSELVTNGIVHAHTALRVVVDVTDRYIRVEVADGNPSLPARRDYDDSAMTGRGMEMVELLSHEFGAEPIDGDGKRVWFRLARGGTSGVAADEPATASPVETTPVEAPKHAPHLTRTVVLRGVPVAIYCAWQQHADALLREATLVALDENGVATGDYPLASQALGALALAASEIFVLRDNGESTADVPLAIGLDAVPWFPILRDVLARATALSSAGRLLTPPSLPEIVALRNWICDEVSRQAAGLKPHPWTALPLEEVGPASASAESLQAVRSSA